MNRALLLSVLVSFPAVLSAGCATVPGGETAPPQTGEAGAEDAARDEQVLAVGLARLGPALRENVASDLPQIQKCYEQGVRGGPEGGRVTVGLTIAPDGRVSAVEVLQDTLVVAAVTRCLTDRVRSWSFPEPGDRTFHISKSFEFRPGVEAEKAFPVEPGAIPGRVKKSAIAAVMQAHRHEVKFCYEREVQHSLALQGQVVLRFVFHAGRVTEAYIAESTFEEGPRKATLRSGPPGALDLLPPPRRVEACLLKKLRTWTFPYSEGLVEVTYPLRFKPST